MIDKKNLQKYIFFKRCKKNQQNCCGRRNCFHLCYSSHLSPFLPDSQHLTVSKFHSRYPHPAYPKFFLCHLTAFTASLSFFLFCYCSAPACSPSSALLSIHVCQAITISMPPIYWFLLSLCLSLSSSILSCSNIYSYFWVYASLSLGFPSLHLSMSFVGCVYTVTTPAVLSYSISSLFSVFIFLPPTNPSTRKPTKPHPSPVFVRSP